MIYMKVARNFRATFLCLGGKSILKAQNAHIADFLIIAFFYNSSVGRIFCKCSNSRQVKEVKQ